VVKAAPEPLPARRTVVPDVPAERGDDHQHLVRRRLLGRVHTDDSFLMRYRQNTGRSITRAAFLVTGDFGRETGDAVTGPTGYPTMPVPTNWSPGQSKQDMCVIGTLLLRF